MRYGGRGMHPGRGCGPERSGGAGVRSTSRAGLDVNIGGTESKGAESEGAESEGAEGDGADGISPLGSWGAGNPAVDGRVHGEISWVTVNGRPRQPEGPCSVEAETARLVRRRTGISANGGVLVLERTADGVGPRCGQVEVQAGHPCSRSGRPIGRVPAAGPRPGSRRERIGRGQARASMPGTRTRVSRGRRRFTFPGRGFYRRGSAS